MRTSVQWINDYLSKPADAKEQAEVLTAVGFPCESSEPVETNDFCQEVETTSNRGDCLSHLGLAREIAAATGRTVRFPAVSVNSASEGANSAVTVANQEPTKCHRYTARVIRGVKVAPSPAWLQSRLRAIGQIPRNNIVDCTNFVLFEYGQPTHVFDLAKLEGSTIEIRGARSGEKFLPIGEGAREIELQGGELVICDARRPVALAGVKGGALSAVTNSTTDVVIEAAAFDPVAVRRTSRSHRIASDSSYRFERGVHPLDLDQAAQRLVSLILETAGGTALAGVVEAGSPVAEPLRVALRLARLDSIAGLKFDALEVVRILDVLGFQPKQLGGVVNCTIPPARMDVTREIDLIEEVVRLAGLDRIPIGDQIGVRPIGPQPLVEATRCSKNSLAGMGFLETVSHTLISERASAPFLAGKEHALRIADERALGEPILRPSLLPSLLAVLKLNLDRGVAACRVFEHAATFWLEHTTHRERRSLSIAAREGKSPQDLLRVVRGACERLVLDMRGADASASVVAITPESCDMLARHGLSSAGTIFVDGVAIGVIGMVNQAALTACGLEGPVAAAELDWEKLSHGFPPVPRASALENSPSLDRDLSVIVDESVAWSALKAQVDAAALKWLESIEFIGVFRGKPIAAGKKSVTMRLTFRSRERTLRREEVDPQIAALSAEISRQLHAEIRA